MVGGGGGSSVPLMSCTHTHTVYRRRGTPCFKASSASQDRSLCYGQRKLLNHGGWVEVRLCEGVKVQGWKPETRGMHSPLSTQGQHPLPRNKGTISHTLSVLAHNDVKR